MLMVRKIKRVSTVPKPELNIDWRMKQNDFSQRVRELESSAVRTRAYLAEVYAQMFPHESFPAGRPISLVVIKISYEMMMRYYKSTGKTPPEKVVINHKAAMAFNFEGFETQLRWILESQNNQGETMKTKTKDKKEKEKKGTTGQRYIEIFDSGKRLSDKQIAEAINREFGKDHDADKVAQYRGYYNSGKIAGQKSKPKEKIAAYIPKADRPATSVAPKVKVKKVVKTKPAPAPEETEEDDNEEVEASE